MDDTTTTADDGLEPDAEPEPKEPPQPEPLTAQDLLLLEDLENWMAGDETPSGPDPELVDVDEVTERAANKLLRRLRGASRELAKINRWADEEVDKANRFRKDRSAGLLRVVEHLEGQLENLARQLIPPGAKRKQINLPNGILKLTAPGASKLVVDDEAAALEWLDKNDYGDCIKTVTTVAVSELKSLASAVPFSDDELEGADPDVVHEQVAIATGETGEDGEPVVDIVPGVHFEKPAKDRFKAVPS